MQMEPTPLSHWEMCRKYPVIIPSFILNSNLPSLVTCSVGGEVLDYRTIGAHDNMSIWILFETCRETSNRLVSGSWFKTHRHTLTYTKIQSERKEAGEWQRRDAGEKKKIWFFHLVLLRRNSFKILQAVWRRWVFFLRQLYVQAMLSSATFVLQVDEQRRPVVWSVAATDSF